MFSSCRELFGGDGSTYMSKIVPDKFWFWSFIRLSLETSVSSHAEFSRHVIKRSHGDPKHVMFDKKMKLVIGP